MNWNRLQTISRIVVQIFLVAILLTVTFLQLMKYMEENTNISSSYDDDKGYLELPSFTFCPNPWEYLLKGQEKLLERNTIRMKDIESEIKILKKEQT